MTDLVSLLKRRLGSSAASTEILAKTREALGVSCDLTDPGLVALALCSLGVRAEEVSKLLSWREFESFCANVFRSAGFEVEEDVRLRNPRAQIDLVARGKSLVLSVDCKHWKREVSLSALAKLASAQLARNEQLRRDRPAAQPMFSVIVTLADQQERFVAGAAVVPLHLLRSFLDSVEGFTESMLPT